MKNLFAILALLIFATFQTNAQKVSYGLEIGVAPTLSANTSHVFANRATPRQEFAFNVMSTGSAVYLGAFTQIELTDAFFLNIKARYNQKETAYKSVYTWSEKGRSVTEQVYTEKVKQLDIPATLGVRLGDFDVNSGFVAHLNLSNSNTMSDVIGFRNEYKKIDFGFQTGLGYNIANLRIGMTYELDFKNYGSHLYVNDQSLALLNSPSRIIATIGYTF